MRMDIWQIAYLLLERRGLAAAELQQLSIQPWLGSAEDTAHAANRLLDQHQSVMRPPSRGALIDRVDHLYRCPADVAAEEISRLGFAEAELLRSVVVQMCAANAEDHRVFLDRLRQELVDRDATAVDGAAL